MLTALRTAIQSALVAVLALAAFAPGANAQSQDPEALAVRCLTVAQEVSQSQVDELAALGDRAVREISAMRAAGASSEEIARRARTFQEEIAAEATRTAQLLRTTGDRCAETLLRMGAAPEAVGRFLQIVDRLADAVERAGLLQLSRIEALLRPVVA